MSFWLKKRRIVRFGFCVSIMVLLGGGVWAALPEQVQVRLFEAHPGLQAFRLQGTFRVLGLAGRTLPNGSMIIRLERGQVVLRQGTSGAIAFKGPRLVLQAFNDRGLTVSPESGLNASSGRSLEPRRYSGQLVFSPGISSGISAVKGGQLLVFNTVPARHYVAVVIASETLPDWPFEALKAQAVITQTRLARYRLGDALGDSTQQEAYLGNTHLRPLSEQAVKAVWGHTLTQEGRSMTPYYHASCGGHTSDEAFFSGDMPVKSSGVVVCPYCAKAVFSQATVSGAPFAKPTVSVIPAAQFQSVFGGGAVKILRTDVSGRPLRVQVGDHQLTGYQFWLKLGQRLGWGKAPGTRFQVQSLPGGKVRITSTGAGHGVGLCQWGAAAMARQGKTYAQILKFYFPQVTLRTGR